MRNILSLLSITLIMLACKEDELKDKGLLLIEPSSQELAGMKYNIGDSLKVTLIYQGNEPLLYIYANCKGEEEILENVYQRTYWRSYHYPVSNHTPIVLSWPIPENWSDTSKNVKLISRFLELQAITENHILDYQYELNIE